MNMTKIVVCGLMAVPMLVEAMPSKADLDAVSPVVADLMKPEQDALKAGKKTKSEVADAALELVRQADGEAAKLLLAKGAFNLYVRDGQFDKALDTLKIMRTEVPDLTPQYLANIIETSLKRVPKKNGGQLYQLLDETKTLARYQDELKKMEAQAKKRPADKALQTKLAEHYAVLGDWTKALEAFAKGEDAKAAQLAKDEQDGAKDAKAIADFWWGYPDKKGEEFEKSFKQHAATLYSQAVASGKLVGLNKVQCERRIEEAKTFGDAVYEVSAEMDSFIADLGHGEKLEFIKCPAGEFTMGWPADVVEKAGGFAGAFTEHKVKITRPFLMTKCAITKGQWGVITGNGDVGDEKKTITNMVEVLRFFEKLEHILGPKVPKGYEVRFPTEAEHEYALKAGDPTSVYSRYHVAKDVELEVVSGANKWGLANMRTPAWWSLCFQDTVGSQMKFNGGTIACLEYEKEMVDPVWSVGSDMHMAWQGGWCYRGAYGKGFWTKGDPNSVIFHAVVAPMQESLNKYPRAK